jgi:hypothetical protein
MYGKANGKRLLVVGLLLLSGVLHAANAKKGLDKDAKMPKLTGSQSTFGVDTTYATNIGYDGKDAKRPLTCGKLGVELKEILEKEGDYAFSEQLYNVLLDMPTTQAAALLVPIAHCFGSHIQAETLEELMIHGDFLDTCLDCFTDRLTVDVISHVVTNIIRIVPLGAVDKIKLLATDYRTKDKITKDAINEPFRRGSLMSRESGHVRKRLEILEFFQSLEVTRGDKVLPTSFTRSENDHRLYGTDNTSI